MRVCTFGSYDLIPTTGITLRESVSASRCFCRVHILVQSQIPAAIGTSALICYCNLSLFQMVPTDNDLCVFKIYAHKCTLETSWLPILSLKALFGRVLVHFCCLEYPRRKCYGDVSSLSDASVVSLNSQFQSGNVNIGGSIGTIFSWLNTSSQL